MTRRSLFASIAAALGVAKAATLLPKTVVMKPRSLGMISYWFATTGTTYCNIAITSNQPFTVTDGAIYVTPGQQLYVSYGPAYSGPTFPVTLG
jgi:hypothetical protein